MRKFITMLLALCSAPGFAAAPYSIDLSAGYISDDNITNGRDGKDIEEDTILSVDAGIHYNLGINDISGITLGATLGLQQYGDFDRLNNTDLRFSADYRIQPQTHYTAPWYFATLSLGTRDYDSNFRDDTYQELGLGAGKRITDTVSLVAGFSRFSGDADNNLFDVDYNRIYINVDLKTGAGNTLYLMLQRFSGDIISTNVPPHPAQLAGITWIDDDAYPTLSFPWTYKLDADTNSLQLGDNFAIDSHQAIDASITLYDSDAYGGFSYDRTIIKLYYLYRF